MIKVGKILEIRRFLGDFFDFFAFVDFFVGDFGSSSEHSEQLGLFGVGILGATRSNSEHSECGGDGGGWGLVGAGVWQPLSAPRCSECSGAFGVGCGGGDFLLVVWVFFVNLQKCYGSFFEKKFLRFF